MGRAEATRRRLLDAATDEFAAYGIAGARVDRIAAAAHANKAQLYAYFGSKEGLFDAVFRQHLVGLMDAVPLTGGDLPRYAVRLYDFYLTSPTLVRLAMWARLERRPHGELVPDDESHQSKIDEIVEAQQTGVVDPTMDPRDVHALVIAMSHSWSPVSLTYATHLQDDGAGHDRRRRQLREAVRRAVAPPDAVTPG
ncbi:TetR family transcriptional regulator [Phytoactinopolyspora halotolerans]|uniref:TetR/AcrR family transcriptional regulator n=1 Tax=Phytoactinopolyspora halotolerans TaxID=1981512 RepID=A0A6L9SGE8_9ACTN|nr:TetR family transcriptional regulator [Phytoactinopolyspora halotolerans]NEE04445.1 TetR/AcrR family transcriptional regulator [Phytoactinopolyspora halotolerans]